MDPKSVKSGMQCTTSDGSLVEVLAPLPDNVHFRVKYIDSLDNPDIDMQKEYELPFDELIGEFMGNHAEGLT